MNKIIFRTETSKRWLKKMVFDEWDELSRYSVNANTNGLRTTFYTSNCLPVWDRACTTAYYHSLRVIQIKKKVQYSKLLLYLCITFVVCQYDRILYHTFVLHVVPHLPKQGALTIIQGEKCSLTSYYFMPTTDFTIQWYLV